MESDGGGVFLAYLGIDTPRAACRERVEGCEHEGAADAAPSRTRMDGKILHDCQRSEMRRADDVRAFHRDENARWIDPLIPAVGPLRLAEDRRAALALPEACCARAVGGFNQLLVGPWTERGRHNAMRPQCCFRHAG